MFILKKMKYIPKSINPTKNKGNNNKLEYYPTYHTLIFNILLIVIIMALDIITA